MLNRREFLAAGAGAAALAGREQKPNVIVVLLDDMGSHDFGCQGATDVKTPNIDSLAAGGARFTNWYSNAPMCAPSRATLMTGRYPARCGVPRNGMPLPPREQTIPALLKSAGYATGLVGKWHLGSTPETVPNARGFNYFYGFHSGCVDFYSHRYYWGEPRVTNYHDLWRNRTEIFENGQYLTERLTQEAVGFIEAHRSQPFFLYLAYNAVHYPMHAPKRYIERFPGLEPERQMYAAMLAAADDGVGEVMKTLEKSGVRDNTLVIFTADNGATTEARAGLNQHPATAGKNTPYRGYKFSVFDGGMHVPAIFNWPGTIPAGQVIRGMAMTADILPTICAAAGVRVPEDRTIDGSDALPLVTAGAKSRHPDVFWDSDKQQAVRRGRWKLVVNGAVYDGTPEGRKPLEGDDAMFLSDLEEDPGETRNLRRKHPEIVDELATAIGRWQEAVTKD